MKKWQKEYLIDMLSKLKIFLPFFLFISLSASDFGNWNKYTVINDSWMFIQNMKDEFYLRADAVKRMTGEKVAFNFRYFHKMTEKQKKIHDRFLKGRLSNNDTEKHINAFLMDLEFNRKILAKAELKAEEAWNEKAAKEAAKPKEEDVTNEAELYGLKIKAKKLGVILDKSGSMREFLPRLRAEIKVKFPNAYFIEIYGSIVSSNVSEKTISNNSWFYVKPDEDQNPFAQVWHCQAIPQRNPHYFVAGLNQGNINAISALALDKKVDALYWFTDMKDKVYDDGLRSLDYTLKKSKVKLYVHTVGRLPTSKLGKVIKANQGEVSRQQIRR